MMLCVINCISSSSNQSLLILWRSHRKYFQFQSAKDLLQEKIFLTLQRQSLKHIRFCGKIVLRLAQTTLLLWFGRIKWCMDICVERILRSLWLVVFVTSFILLQKGAACLPLDVSQLLIDVYYYLDKSSKRQSFFKEIHFLHDVKQGKILKHISTRWLSIKKCLP